MNPLDMTGPAFLRLYAIVLVGAVAVAVALRRASRSPYDGPDVDPVELDPYEVAYLAGKDDQAADAAIASLVHRGVLTVNARTRTIGADGPLPSPLHPLEREVAPDPRGEETERTIKLARSHASPTLGKIRERLRALGLLVDDGTAWKARLLSLLPIVMVLLLGLMKLQVGLDRHKPVGLLKNLCVFTGIIGIGFLVVRPSRSRRGDLVLEDLRRRNAALRMTGSQRAVDLSGQDLALAMALFGSGILVGGPLDELRTALSPPSSSDGGGGDGGGDGGGGGGGGGGCGGCGGG